MKVEWVRQEDALGCLVACIAMIAGVSYAEARSTLPGFSADKCADEYYAVQWLKGRGFDLIRTWEYFKPYGSKKPPSEPWPPLPFAELHLCSVMAGGRLAHAVIMLGDGTVIDPATPEPRKLSDYSDVYQVSAIVRIPHSDSCLSELA